MRNTWARAWLAATTLLVAASAIARNRHDTLLDVEEPVMDWLLDGTNTSGWDRAEFLSSSWLLITATVLLTIAVAFLDWRVAVTVVLTSAFATALAIIVRNIVERPTPRGSTSPGSFPSVDLVQTGVLLGLIVLSLWWVGAPRLVWQIATELAIVIELVVAIRLSVTGAIWPSDAVGSIIVIAVSLILAAVVFEAVAQSAPRTRRNTVVDDPVAA